MIDSHSIDQFVCDNEEQILRDMARLVAIPSVESEAEEGAPFGRESRRALDCALEIAGELGLKTVNCENRLGYATIGEDDGRPYLATITHVDVVPAGDGWEADPFVLREKDGYLIGRGIMDDKGPSVLCLYALKYLQESGTKLRYPIRALLGSNEETGMEDVEHYIANYPLPVFCFSPDADFPLIHGEKGIYHGLLLSCCPQENILKIEGGVAPNAVPAGAAALVRAEGLRSVGRVTAEEKEPGLWHLSATGISGHASMPDGTVNAIAELVSYLLENDIPSAQERPYYEFLARLHSATDGSGVGLQSSDESFTPLTAVGGRISIEDERVCQTIDVRYGLTMSAEKIEAALPDSPAVRACLDSYNEVTGENARSFTIGGGTYARHFPNAVAFGPEHPERPYPDFCGPIHGVNEAARKSDMLEALKVYIHALLRLESLDL